MAVNLHLRDYRLDTSGWRNALGRHFDNLDSDADDVGLPDDAAERIVFLHTDASILEDDKKAWCAQKAARHVVLIRSGGRVPPINANEVERVHTCWWKPSEFVPTAFPEIRALVASIKNGDSDWWKWLQPTGHTLLSALSILCQGYQAARGDFAARVSTKGRQEILTPEWWRKPFDQIPENEVQELLARAFGNQTPPEIAALVGWIFDPKPDTNLDEVVKNALKKLPVG